jgi:hypothetical protein
MIRHLLCCQGLAVANYGFALDAADLEAGSLWILS